MDIVLTIVSIVIFGFVINVLLKQSYNFIFFIGQKPFIWILAVAIIGVFAWGLSAIFGWGVNIPTWASTMAFFMNLPPSYNNSDEKESAHQMVDEFYAEMGLKNGRLLYRFGLASFVFSCLASWVLFYGEVCSGNECQSILESVS
ncbi:MAG: hypothetical protein HFP76_00020 [Methylococcales symbiont of Iophon sp. n. MRB-2018]|nr:MAG: hypothetical protein HFP76_00020 [Methylococcales symbiont of Iophon sp. n. MRB-2018]